MARRTIPGQQSGQSCYRFFCSSPALIKVKGQLHVPFLWAPKDLMGSWSSGFMHNQFIYAQAQYRAQLTDLRAPEVSCLSVCTRLASLNTWEWRRPWHGAFPITRVTFVAKLAEDTGKQTAGSSSLRLLKRDVLSFPSSLLFYKHLLSQIIPNNSQAVCSPITAATIKPGGTEKNTMCKT